MKTRTDLINHLIIRHNFSRYIEIGIQNPEQNFNKIKCDYKVSVDPDPKAKALFCMTSDDFFNYGINNLRDEVGFLTLFDIIFIDGLHTAEQVEKDFRNAQMFLSPNGVIVLHDCSPAKEEHTIVPRPTATGHWNGDVYKFASRFQYSYITVDIDNGCLVYFNYDGGPELRSNIPSWSEFDENRKTLLNICSWLDFEEL